MKLSSLLELDDFALLAPAFGDGTQWTLVTGLQRSDEGAQGLWFARYSTKGRDATRLTGQVQRCALELDVPPAPLEVRLEERGFLEGVEVIREHIAAGDVYQVNLTARANVRCWSGAQLLSTLCRRGVPRFAAWVKSRVCGEFVSASPELLIELNGRHLHAEPMKGTAAPDSHATLEASEKDRAELAMITDLLRDDLHRLCEPRSVKVTNERRFIGLPYVVQTVSDVEGTLRPELSVRDVLDTVHPGGSVTGAPRLAAMSVIRSLERSARGAYCGALGWQDGERFRAALLIRTAENTGPSMWVYGVGGGITWDSSPTDELAEVHLKLGALS